MQGVVIGDVQGDSTVAQRHADDEEIAKAKSDEG
jgi:hypothetical protein